MTILSLATLLTTFLFPASTAAVASPNLPMAASGDADAMYDCPAGETSRMTSREYREATSAYRVDYDVPGSIVPGSAPKIPTPRFDVARRKDPDFPASGMAHAHLLFGEDGRVDDVLVPCSTSEKLVEPVVKAMKKARVDSMPTRDGIPMRVVLVVPVNWGS